MKAINQAIKPPAIGHIDPATKDNLELVVCNLSFRQAVYRLRIANDLPPTGLSQDKAAAYYEGGETIDSMIENDDAMSYASYWHWLNSHEANAQKLTATCEKLAASAGLAVPQWTQWMLMVVLFNDTSCLPASLSSDRTIPGSQGTPTSANYH